MRTSLDQSGMFFSGNSIDRVDKIAPGVALFLQNCLAQSSQLVVSPPALTSLFDPSPNNESTFFEAIEQRIKRGDIELERTFGTLFYEFADFIPVSRTMFDQREDKQFRTAFLQFPIKQFYSHMYHSHI